MLGFRARFPDLFPIMHLKLKVMACLAACILSSAVLAQEGYPLDGTWRGEWGPVGATNRVVIVMKWDGETINGTLNPGPNSISFSSAQLDPSNWTVHIEATGASGETIVIDGTLENIGAYNRTIQGTWEQDGSSNPLSIARE